MPLPLTAIISLSLSAEQRENISSDPAEDKAGMVIMETCTEAYANRVCFLQK